MSEGPAPPVLVVDNNVAVKWYVPQDFGEEALRVFHAGQNGEALLVAPTLIHAEFGNALWRYHQQGELSAEEAQEFWEDFSQAPISLFDMAPLVPKALEISTQCRCTVYDALYLSRLAGSAATALAALTLAAHVGLVNLYVSAHRLLRLAANAELVHKPAYVVADAPRALVRHSNWRSSSLAETSLREAVMRYIA